MPTKIMKTFTRTKTETFTPLWIKIDFSIYDEEFIRIRSAMRYKCAECFKCHKPFSLGDSVGLVAFKNVGNKVICKGCAEELSEKS